MSRNHAFVNSDKTKFDSNCAVCGGKDRDSVHRTAEVTSAYTDKTQPYKVRTGCGHIVIRRMRGATAGVPFSEAVILDAPNGRPCDECERKQVGGSK